MSRRQWHDEDNLIYYELVCDACGTSLICYDDSCYDWGLLRDAGTWAGWDTRRDQPTGPHYCVDCQRRHATAGQPDHRAERQPLVDKAGTTPAPMPS
jgi:hypothetical protein